VKLATLKARLLGGPQRAVAVHVATEARTTAPIARFLAAMGPVDRLADTAAGLR
jgi:hypothetical protein